MPSLENIERVYQPAALKIMAAAFDNAYGRLPTTFKQNERARRKLALIVLRNFERGVRESSQLADMALLDFFR